MGMKRQGAGRKQVLNLENKKKEPQRVSWQSKYVQICADHITTNGTSETFPNEEEVTEPKVNALHGLSGYLSSDSSSEQSDHESELQGEVKAFLKEIEELTPPVPAKKPVQQNTVAKQSPPTTTEPMPLTQEAVTSAYSMPTISWQECYDNSTGYTYYWNVETNQVTWEMPPEYQNYMLTLKHWQQLQAHNAIMQARLQQQVPQEYDVQPKETAERHVIDAQPKLTRKNPFLPKSDSEDEKIELITSYGPTSGDESSSEETVAFKTPTAKKKKTRKPENSSNLAFGPQLPPVTYASRDFTTEEKTTHSSLVPYHPEYEDSECDDSFENSKLSFIPDTGPPGLEDEQVESKATVQRKSEKKVEEVPSEEKEQQGPHLEEQKQIKTLVSPSYEQGEETEIEESIILDRIRSQTQVLKELGGEIPEEVKNIITEDTKKEPEVQTKLSLVPGYGDDSDHEEEDGKDSESSKDAAKAVKLPLRGKQLANVSTATAKARGTDFIESPDLLKPIETKETGEEQCTNGDVAEPPSAASAFKAELSNLEAPPGTKRKLKLEVPETPKSKNEPGVSSIDLTSKGDYMGWNQNPDVEEPNERRGFGFGVNNEWAKKPKLDRIQFIKAEILNPPEQEPSSPEKEPEEKQTSDDILDLSGLLADKMKFLSESKDPVSPVQKWAIQLETLVKAWERSELSTSYIREWLSTTSEELSRLETSVAPQGWLCQWQSINASVYSDTSTNQHYLINIHQEQVRRLLKVGP